MAPMLDQLYKAHLQLIGVATAVAGIALLEIGHLTHSEGWLAVLPITELGSTLTATGLLAVFFEYLNRKNMEQRTEKQIRDSIFSSFAAEPAMLASIAGSPMGERIAVNALAARLGDAELAQAVYDDASAQVIGAPERWRDVVVTADLAPWAGGPATGPGSMFVLTLSCDYRVTPTQPTLRFTCTSNEDAYRASGRDDSSVSSWFIEPLSVDVTSRDAFEVVSVEINGKLLDIECATTPDSQTYTATMPDAALGRSVVVFYTYRVLVPCAAHLLWLDVPRPTKGFTAVLNYGKTSIRHVSTVEYLGNSAAAVVRKNPASVPARSVAVRFDGWIFPRAGVAFVWVLDDQLSSPLMAG